MPKLIQSYGLNLSRVVPWPLGLLLFYSPPLFLQCLDHFNPILCEVCLFARSHFECVCVLPYTCVGEHRMHTVCKLYTERQSKDRESEMTRRGGKKRDGGGRVGKLQKVGLH